MWWDGVMFGIDTWQDLSAVIAVCGAAVAAIAWLVRVAVVGPLRTDIQNLHGDIEKLTKSLSYELALDNDEPMRDRVVRVDSEVTGLRRRVGRLEGYPYPNRG